MKKTGISVVALALVLIGIGCSARHSDGRGGGGASDSGAAVSANVAQTQKNAHASTELLERLRKICERAGVEVGLAVIHVESGESVEIEGARQLPLYSVFKLPLAIAVLKAVEENRLRLDQKVIVTPEEVLPGWQGNTDLWRNLDTERTIAQLLELSIVRSDNTSSDKLLQLVGGPGAVRERMRALGLEKIDIHFTVREFLARQENPNTGTASDLARLLVLLQKGEALAQPQLSFLLDLMKRVTTGERRLRGQLPAGTPVADKTGTGETTTNDVGIITLPEGQGHLAMAVFVNGSKLSAERREKLIAELARTAYDAHVSRSAIKDYAAYSALLGHLVFGEKIGTTPDDLLLIREGTVSIAESDLSGLSGKVNPQTIEDFRTRNAESAKLKRNIDVYVDYHLIPDANILSPDSLEFKRKYPRAKGILSLSKVGFDPMRTQALVFVELDKGSNGRERAYWLVEYDGSHAHNIEKLTEREN